MNTGKNKRVKSKKAKGLSPEWYRINDFFMILDEDGPSNELWKMLKLALIVNNDNTDERDRSNMIFLYENTKKLFEDVFTLLEKEKKRRGVI